MIRRKLHHRVFSWLYRKIILRGNYIIMEPRSQVLADLLNKNNLRGFGAEIGVYQGGFSRQLLRVWPGHLYLVDYWRHIDENYLEISNKPDKQHEKNYQTTLKVLQPYKDRITVMRQLSHEAAAQLPDGSFDFIYIDANHAYEAIKADLELWWPKLKDGGLFSGHDYLDAELDIGIYGVKRAVDEFAHARGYKVNVIESPWPSWWFFKEPQQTPQKSGDGGTT